MSRRSDRRQAGEDGFTRFREVTAPLVAFLGSVFERPGLVLHGETEVAPELVRHSEDRRGILRYSQKPARGLNRPPPPMLCTSTGGGIPL